MAGGSVVVLRVTSAEYGLVVVKYAQLCCLGRAADLDEQAARQKILDVRSSYDPSAGTTPPPKREPFVGHVTLEPRQGRRCQRVPAKRRR